MVVMDQYTRRIIRFAVHAGNIDGQALCRMFNNSAITTRASVGSNFPPAIQSVVDWTSKPETSDCSRALSCLHLFQHSLHLGMHHIDSL
jgi:hypothetical protein